MPTLDWRLEGFPSATVERIEPTVVPDGEPTTARPTVVADPMAAAKGRAIAERAQATERARLATFRVGVHVNDIGEAS